MSDTGLDEKLAWLESFWTIYARGSFPFRRRTDEKLESSIGARDFSRAIPMHVHGQAPRVCFRGATCRYIWRQCSPPNVGEVLLRSVERAQWCERKKLKRPYFYSPMDGGENRCERRMPIFSRLHRAFSSSPGLDPIRQTEL